jgi:hypothetical protein
MPYRAIKALVVGGEPSFVDAKFAPHLVEAGIEPIGHWSWDLKKPPHSLPDCDLVVVIKDMVPHMLRDQAIMLAKRRGLRIAEVPRKWVKAEKHLTELGLVHHTVPPPATEIATVAEAMEVARAVSLAICREGRLPAAAEIHSKAALKGIDPDLLEDSICKEAIHHGLARAKTEGIIIMDMERKNRTAGSLTDWTEILLDDDPARILDLKALFTEVTTNLAKDNKIPNKETSRKWAAKIIGDAAKAVKQGWVDANQRGLLKGDAKVRRDKLMALKGAVLVRYVGLNPEALKQDAEAYIESVFGTHRIPDIAMAEVKRAFPDWAGVKHSKWAEMVAEADAIPTAPTPTAPKKRKKRKKQRRRPAWAKIEEVIRQVGEIATSFPGEVQSFQSQADLAELAGVSRESVRSWLKETHGGDWTKVVPVPVPEDHSNGTPELESSEDAPEMRTVEVTFGEQMGEQILACVGQLMERVGALESIQKAGKLDRADRIGAAVAELVKCGCRIDFGVDTGEGR